MTQVMHHVDLILSHCAKGIVDLVFAWSSPYNLIQR